MKYGKVMSVKKMGRHTYMSSIAKHTLASIENKKIYRQRRKD